MTIDASQAMGRVTFEKSASLGVLYNGYKPEQPLTVPKGEIQEIVVYNGNVNQPVSVTVVTSGAQALAATAATAALVSLSLF